MAPSGRGKGRVAKEVIHKKIVETKPVCKKYSPIKWRNNFLPIHTEEPKMRAHESTK